MTMTAIAALVVGLLLILALGALVAVLTGVPFLAIILLTSIMAVAAFYLITNSLLKRRVVEKKSTPAPIPAAPESDHIS